MAIPINDAIAISKQIDSGTSSVSVHIGPTGVLGIMVQKSTAQTGYGRLGSGTALRFLASSSRGHSWLAE
ncbi:MAG: hypothetical protein LC749_14435 [Actinobacteria bacterium]|nr:hypothetical protein [Actinomycetota bacterium]